MSKTAASDEIPQLISARVLTEKLDLRRHGVAEAAAVPGAGGPVALSDVNPSRAAPTPPSRRLLVSGLKRWTGARFVRERGVAADLSGRDAEQS